jgi:Tfp pilus assembly protein FimT
MNKRKRPGGRKGASLMEAILVMALAFVLLLGTAETFVLALRVQSRARSIRDMTGLLSDRLELLRAEAAASSAAGGPASVADGSASAAGRDGRLYALSWAAASGAGSPMEIEVRIAPQGSPERAMSAQLFISRELGF